MNLQTQSILNADDYAPGRYARTKVLQQAGFEVIEAASGAQTLELVSERKPALVLLDVNLPDLNGIEVCRRIREDPKTVGTTIVHISATYTESQHMVRGLDSGADSYLVEPVDPRVLIATVKAFLRARQAEERLRRSNEDLERFAYMVVHELNEPLRTITSHAQLLERRLGERLDEQSAESFQFVMGGARRMRSFIDDLLRYSHATHGHGDLRTLDLEAVLTQVLFSLDAVIGSKGARITHDPLPTIVADVRIEHVLQNLIANSIKYARPDTPPEIHISAGWERGIWIFSVRDNGIGIAPEYKSGIFHLFRRLHGRDVPGHGIGLALCQKIVEANGGTIWVESDPGVGSTFYFTVPQEQANRATRTSRS
jgi:signal transduction histidine kinase